MLVKPITQEKTSALASVISCCVAVFIVLSLCSAGRAEERRDVQRSPGQLRQLDEHQPERSYLHLKGKAELCSHFSAVWSSL